MRVGPNKVSVSGVLQPISDAIKLLSKALFIPQRANSIFFNLSPSLSLILALLMYFLVVDYFFDGKTFITLVVFLFLISIGVFPRTLAGWASNRAYARVGGYRSLRQSVSYEVILFLRLFSPLALLGNLALSPIRVYIITFLSINVFLFIIIVLAETNRAPFDLSEGERELVSGFNIEYGGAGFTLFFLAEYAIILLMRIWLSVLFTGRYWWGVPGMLILLIIRSAYPRIRYDSLIIFSWLICLPIITAACILAFSSRLL